MALLIYIFKSAAILSLFFMAYVTLLKNETFFKANRQFLLVGIVAALIAPALVLTRTVYKVPVVYFDIPEDLLLQAQSSSVVEETFSFWQLGVFIYSIGVAVMLFLFSKKLIQIFSFLKNTRQQTSNGYHFLQIDGLDAPFSFFNYIVLDAQAHSEDELEMILLHEKAHANQRHSLDMFLVQFVLIIQWFNPLAWLYKNGVVQNLEYLADATTASQIEDRKNYQLALVKVAAPQFVPALAHSFYQSFIKKRIVMLNKQSSSEFRKWKILLIVPVLGAFMWSFNVKEEVKFKVEPLSDSEVKKSENALVVSPSQTENQNKTNLSEIIKDQPKQFVTKNEQTSPKAFKKVITPKMTKGDIEQLVEELDSDYNIEMDFSKLRYNSNGEITQISISVKDRETGNKASATYNTNDKALTSIVVYRTADGTFGVVSGHNTIVQRSKLSAAELQEREQEMQERRQEMEARKAEMMVRREAMKNRLNDSIRVTEKMKERMVEMELRKAEMQSRMEERKAELEIRKAEIKERRAEMLNMSDDSVFFQRRPIHASEYKTSDSKYHITYRGKGNLNAKALFIIDGEEVDEYELKNINPDDIESIDIIKGDNAIQLYGAEKMKGKTGAILITTKKANNKK
ncbi:M56 family metallopeptidase [Leeuwenhoekiella polynyae]|uniref:TonB-dependent receptor-like protein n=1 Tax=Leeuwenhoekiella polynyae TaxID=1550906 RepID=A0A4V1KR90_9FLAO|nr:M56 family metallopeptidase [Leeuwenhoekiella polynyae]RXG24082.1 TonB-dependent receptor-like protein [Leeuwenhoekiella polynyae]